MRKLPNNSAAADGSSANVSPIQRGVRTMGRQIGLLITPLDAAAIDELILTLEFVPITSEMGSPKVESLKTSKLRMGVDHIVIYLAHRTDIPHITVEPLESGKWKIDLLSSPA